MGNSKTTSIAWQLEAFRIISERGRYEGIRTNQVHAALCAGGWQISDRAVRAGLKKMADAGLLVAETATEPDAENPKDRRSTLWSVAHDAGIRTESMGSHTALSLVMVEQMLSELLPAATIESLHEQFIAAHLKLDIGRPAGAQWQQKIRLLPGWQKLLPAEFAAEVRDTLFHCLLLDQRCHLAYRHSNNCTESLDVCPLAIIKRGVVFYLIARPGHATDEHPLILPLHRILHVENTQQRFVRGDFNIDSFLASGAEGFCTDAEAIDLEMLFSHKAGRHLFETPLARGQNLATTSDGLHLRLRASVLLTPQLRWWIMGFGADAEVVAPEFLRNEMAATVNRMAARYSLPQSVETATTLTPLSKMDEDLKNAFLRTHYRLDAPAAVSFYINQPCTELDAVLVREEANSGIFITAFNPYGGWQPAALNTKAQHNLEQALAGAGYRFLRGTGSDPDGRWSPETSVLVLGMTKAEGEQWAHDWCQSAVVFVQTQQAPVLVLVENPLNDEE